MIKMRVERLNGSFQVWTQRCSYYAPTQVPSTAAIDSDEVLIEDADPINGHYSKHNVDRRAKRVKAKVSKLQAEVRENKKKVQHAEEKLAQAQLDITEANTLRSQLKAQVRSVLKQAQESQTDRDSYELERDE